MKQPYAICRTKKLHYRDLVGASCHNFRTRKVANADPDGKITTLIGTATSNDFLTTVQSRFEQWKTNKLAAVRNKRGAKMAHDPVVCVELMLSASPEYFRPDKPDAAGYWQADRLQAWEKVVKKFAVEHFGDNLVSLVLHLDEATPHAHILMMPFDDTNNLNAKIMFNRQGLIRLQDAYADACQPLGLQRGLRGSKASHETIKDFYGVINRETPIDSLNPKRASVLKLPNKLDRLQDDKMTAFADEMFVAGVQAANDAVEARLLSISDKANAYDLIVRKEKEVSIALSEAKKLAGDVRTLPLNEVLQKMGAANDASDVKIWHINGKQITLNGSKYYDTFARVGGGGAIDLVKYCEGVDFEQAVSWLALEFGKNMTVGESMRSTREAVSEKAQSPAPLPTPKPFSENIQIVFDHLTHQRHIPRDAVQSLAKSGDLYADINHNVVIKLQGKDGKVGAELHGTGKVPNIAYRGWAGIFSLKTKNKSNTKKITLVRTALEAICFRAIYPLGGWVCAIASAGVEDFCQFVKSLQIKGYEIVVAIKQQSQTNRLLKRLREFLPLANEQPPRADNWVDELSENQETKNTAGLRLVRNRLPKPSMF